MRDRRYMGPDLSMYRARRRALLVSVQEVAKALGVTYSAVSNWELGRAIPSDEKLKEYKALIEALTSSIQDQDLGPTFINPNPSIILKDPRKKHPSAPEGIKICMVCNSCGNQTGLIFVSHSTGCRGYGCECKPGGVACVQCGAIDSSDLWKALGVSVFESSATKPKQT